MYWKSLPAKTAKNNLTDYRTSILDSVTLCSRVAEADEEDCDDVLDCNNPKTDSEILHLVKPKYRCANVHHKVPVGCLMKSWKCLELVGAAKSQAWTNVTCCSDRKKPMTSLRQTSSNGIQEWAWHNMTKKLRLIKDMSQGCLLYTSDAADE